MEGDGLFLLILLYKTAIFFHLVYIKIHYMASIPSPTQGIVWHYMWERLGTPWKLVKPGEREPASQGLPRVGQGL